MTPRAASHRVAVVAVLSLGLAAAPRASAQVPACGASDRHFDPFEVPMAPIIGSRVFYVDGANGSDANDGLSEGAPFKTIGKAIGGFSAPIAPGDTVRIKAGTYRERITVNKSGTAANGIMIGAYGNGPVVLDASTAATWTLVSGQVYKAHTASAATAVVVDDQPLFPEFSQGALVEGRFYYNSAAGDLYLWAPGGGNPGSRDVIVVKDDSSETALFVSQAGYLTLYGLTVRGSGGHGIAVLGDFVRIEKCRSRFNGKAGINGFSSGSITTTNLTAIKNDVYHNMMRNWPRGRYKWGGWAFGLGSQATPNALFQGNVVHTNGGEGILAYLGAGGTVFRDNVVYDNWSVNVYVDNQTNVVIENNFVYNHQPDPGDMYHNGDATPGDGEALKRLRPDGIVTADENYGTTPPARLNNVTIANNVVVNCRRGVNHNGEASGSGLKNVKFLHNTVVVPAATVTGEFLPMVGIKIPYNAGNNVGSVYRDNIVYATDPSSSVVYGITASATATEKFQGLTLDHNLWFHTGRVDPFHWGLDQSTSFNYTHAQWTALSGAAHGAGDVYADPQLIDTATVDDVPSKAPLGTSPALNAGVGAGIALDYDFCSRPQGDGFDMGAYESAGGAALPTLSIGNATVTEGNSGTVNAVFTLTLSSASAQSVTVSYATAGGTAVSGTDFTAASGTLTLAPGTTTATLAVAVVGDTAFEPSETFFVNVSGAAGAIIVDAQGVGTITNDDVGPGGVVQFSAATYSVPEAGRTATLTVTRTGSAGAPATVRYATSNGTAAAGSDYAARSGILSFAAGATAATFTVPITPDTRDEADETLNLTLSSPTGGAALGSPAAAVLTIVDDDTAGTVQFASATYGVSEAGPSALIKVVRTGGMASGVKVSYATSNGTALAGSDYTAKSGVVGFGANVTAVTFAIPILNDTRDENDETVGLALSNPAGGAALGAITTAVLTIADNDAGGVIQLATAGYVVSEGSATAVIKLTRTGGAASGVTVGYATSNGTALAGSDYTATSGTLSFGANVAATTFAVPIVRDTLDEPNETVNLSIFSPTGGATLGATTTAVLTINDNDVPGSLQFSAATYTVSEATPAAVITVKRTGGFASGVAVTYATSNGTATAGADYTAASGVLSFGAGVTATTFTVPLTNDAVDEGDETLNVTLSNPQGGATLGVTATAVLMIRDNDP